MKIGFIVEGDTDKTVVEAIARKLLPSTMTFHTVRLGGKAALPTAFTSVIVILSKGYDHVVLLFDADTTQEELVERQKQEVEASLARHGVASHCTVCPVVRSIADWLEQGDPAGGKVTVARPLSLAERADREAAIQRASEALDLDLLRQRNPSFARFADVLASLAGRAAKVSA